jgi:hypothetical protein
MRRSPPMRQGAIARAPVWRRCSRISLKSPPLPGAAQVNVRPRARTGASLADPHPSVPSAHEADTPAVVVPVVVGVRRCIVVEIRTETVNSEPAVMEVPTGMPPIPSLPVRPALPVAAAPPCDGAAGRRTAASRGESDARPASTDGGSAPTHRRSAATAPADRASTATAAARGAAPAAARAESRSRARRQGKGCAQCQRHHQRQQCSFH